MADYNAIRDMRERMKKLAIWYTKTFKPIITHDELEPLMSTLGFFPVSYSPPSSDATSPSSTTAWKEYIYLAGSCSRRWFTADMPPPRPRLPYPRIDGLHIYTYRAFLDAINFYLDRSDDQLSNLFHIRGMPLHGLVDLNFRWKRMEEIDTTIYVYREATLDLPTYNFYNAKKNDVNGSSRYKGHNSAAIIKEDNTSAGSKVVPLTDIVVGYKGKF